MCNSKYKETPVKSQYIKFFHIKTVLYGPYLHGPLSFFSLTHHNPGYRIKFDIVYNINAL